MAASDVTFTAVKTALDLAATAIDAGNYTEARRKLAKARTIRAGIEDSAAASGTLSALDKAYKEILDMIDRLEAEDDQDDDQGRRIAYGRTNFS